MVYTANFKFKLQSYLGVKQKIEDQKKLEYGKALQKLELEEAVKRALESEMADRVNTFREKTVGGIVPHELIAYKRYLSYLERRVAEQEHVIFLARNFAESKRVELVAAMKQRKMVEKLKEKDFEAYLIEEKKAEQKVVDEIVSYKYSVK